MSNTGYRNTGNRNTGDRNTGYRNTGNRNTGDRNTGHRNTGDRNTGNRNTGYLNQTNQKIRIFDIETDTEFGSITFPKWFYFDTVEWVSTPQMTEKEKEENPSHQIA
jgi:hypothetical protein